MMLVSICMIWKVNVPHRNMNGFLLIWRMIIRVSWWRIIFKDGLICDMLIIDGFLQRGIDIN